MTVELEKKISEDHNEIVSDGEQEQQQYEEAELEPKLNWQTVLAFLVG
jgi:hypothetical protein